MKNKIIEIIKQNGVYNGSDMGGDTYIIRPNDIADELIKKGCTIPPCKVGDTFYGIQGEDAYFKYVVKNIIINDYEIWLETVYEMRFLYGKDAFLTEEEVKSKINGW